MTGVTAVGAAQAPALAPPVAAAAPVDGVFAAQLDSAVGRVSDSVAAGDDALVALASGGDVDLHGSMIALEQADIALRAMVSVRDKVVGAYEQLMNLAI
ncbi:MAG: flagellar hook-basal body complex protein FliE [Myxococcota bacterium]